MPIFVLVTGVVLFCIWRWRMRPGEERLDGPPIHGNTRLEIVWTAIPTVIIAVLCAYATVLLLDIQEAPAEGHARRERDRRAVRLDVRDERGRQADPGHADRAARSTSRSSSTSSSKDVLHDFWVPEWRLKVDAVPGITTKYSLTPTKTGRFQVVCAELCGLGHAFMRQFIAVGSAGDFQAWVDDVEAPRPAPAPVAAAARGADGAKLFADGNQQTGATACGACHTLSAAGTSSQTGPNLDETVKGWDAARLREAISDPAKEIAQGFGAGIMPPNYDQTLSTEELDALVEYIQESVNR